MLYDVQKQNVLSVVGYGEIHFKVGFFIKRQTLKPTSRSPQLTKSLAKN